MLVKQHKTNNYSRFVVTKRLYDSYNYRYMTMYLMYHLLDIKYFNIRVIIRRKVGKCLVFRILFSYRYTITYHIYALKFWTHYIWLYNNILCYIIIYKVFHPNDNQKLKYNLIKQKVRTKIPKTNKILKINIMERILFYIITLYNQWEKILPFKLKLKPYIIITDAGSMAG